MTRNQRTGSYLALIALTFAQVYVVNAFLFSAWMTATPNDYHRHWQTRAEIWEVVSVLVGLLWVGSAVLLFRRRRGPSTPEMAAP